MISNIRDREFLGQGLAFPLRVNQRGEITLAKGEEDILQAIRIILETAPGERVMRPEFGCRANEMMFEPRDAATMGRISAAVEEALRRWEPRIELKSVDVAADDENDSALLITINYIVSATHNERSIVYPFYLTEEERELEAAS